MTTLILLVIFGILSAIFATQNTASAPITLASYTISGVPMYLIVLVSLLVGLLLSFIISIANSISSSLTILGKDSTIKATKKNIQDLSTRIHELEVENAKLKGENTTTTVVSKEKMIKE